MASERHSTLPVKLSPSPSPRTLARRPSIFEMLHFGIPREPQYTGHVTMWKMPMSAEEEEEAKERRKRTAATLTTSTISSLPRSRFNRYHTESEINTIYGVCRDNIASRGMSIPSMPPTPQQSHFLPTDVGLYEEKDYIDRCLFQDYTGDNFSKMIMQNFFKAPKARNAGYGMPRPETREGSHDRLITNLSRKPSVVRVPSHSSLCKPVKSDNHQGCSAEFCEILGPGCCSSCIETTNRQIAEEIQRRLFPDVEVSRRCLVAPKLTKLMKDGHLKQMRRKRLHELKQSNSRETGVTFNTRTNDVTTHPSAPKTQPFPAHSNTRDSMRLPPIQPQPTFTPYSHVDGKEVIEEL